MAQSREKRSLEAIRVHVRQLLSHLAHLAPHQVHDATLAPFIAERRAAGVSATTINRSLEVVRTILSRAARSYRDDDGRPWLEALPPLITMLRESRRPPYPITWDEQDRLFQRLPSHLQRMVLFAVNTGLLDANVCGLEWMWEVFVPEIDRSVFVVPAEAFKSNRDHVVAGSTPTIADFSLSGYVFYPVEESGYDIELRFPHLAAWRERMPRLPGWSSPYDVMPGERIAPKWSLD